MKKLFGMFLSLILLVGLSIPVFATESDVAKNSITVDPILCAVGMVGLDYERSIGNKFSIHLGYTSFNYEKTEDEETATLDGSMTVVGGKWYFKEAQHGGYFGLDARLIDVDITGENDVTEVFANGKNTSYAVTLGRKNINNSGFTYDVGLAYLYTQEAETEGFACAYIRLGYGW